MAINLSYEPSKAEIAAVKSMDKFERDFLRDQINQYSPYSLFDTIKGGKEIICPCCGNGTGKDATGVIPSEIGGKWIYGCRRGDCDFNGDLISIIAKVNHLDNRTDFYQVLAIGAYIIGYSLNITAERKIYTSNAKPVSKEMSNNNSCATDEKETALILADIADSQSNLPAFIEKCGGAWRGLIFATLQHFHCGYVENHTSVTSRLNGTFATPTPRVIIPAGNHYLARLTVSKDCYDEKTRSYIKPKQHAGKKFPFNFDAISINGVNVIVEGEVDAMSIWQATNGNVPVIATGGVDGYHQFIQLLKEKFPAHSFNFLILFDGDDAGRNTATKFVDALLRAGHRAVYKFLTGEENSKRDANDILQQEGDAKLAALINEIISVAQDELNAIVLQPPINLDFIKNPAVRNDFLKLRQSPATETRNAAMVDIIRNNLDWKINKSGKRLYILPTSANYRHVFECDPVISDLFGFDEFKQQTVFLKQAPWKKYPCIKENWTDADDKELSWYIRQNYAELAHEKIAAECFSVFSRARSFHVIKDWLNSLPKWDGVKRLETLFIKFLRVADSDYAREVTVNWFTGAISRIFNSGCEYQYCLILQGKQGIGKGYILKALGGDWYVELKDSVDSPNAIDIIQRGWIIEIPELSATRKSELNAVKSFISANSDTRRFAYERRATTVNRHCVFAGTINDTQPFNDQTGARRWLVLECNSKERDFVEGLTREYVAQVWAEALAHYKALFANGFDANKLLLSRQSQETAAQIAEGFTSDDGLKAEIAAFIDKPIPAEPIWKLATKEERRRFFAEGRLHIEQSQLIERQKARRRTAEMEELDAVLADANYEDVDVKGNNYGRQSSYVRYYNFYGDRLREHISAAEILNEMFTNGDRRRNIRRVNEILPQIDGWQKGSRVRNDTVYGDQKTVYYRIAPAIYGDEDYNANEVEIDLSVPF